MNLNLDEKSDKPLLVSIVVITYNSSKYVIETLESAKAQTYQNIELIISDDCSIDNTGDICRQWLEKNRTRFARIELLTSSKNTGITSNCNRGVKASKGLWVKYFAGDDLLLPNCISDYIQYIQNTPECSILCGKINRLKGGSLIERTDFSQIFSLPREKQYRLFLKGSNIPAQSIFFKREAFDSVGGFNENYAFSEDHLFYLALFEKGYKFHYLNKSIAIHRNHDTNISGEQTNKKWVNTKFYNSCEKLFLKEIIQRQFKKYLFIDIFSLLNWIFITRIILLFGNKKNMFSKLISYFYITGTISSIKKLVNKFSHKKDK